MRFFSERTLRIGLFIAFLCLGAFSAVTPAFAGRDPGPKSDTAANIADDDLSGEDIQIRRIAIDALGTAEGTVVVMNAQTGQILTIVNQEWAIRHAFKPCSTIKLVTGVAGISEHLINSDGSLARGTYRLGLDDALAYSNNGYFQKVGSSLGSEKLISYALRLGLGSPTGINVEGETAGKLPFGNENLRIYSHADDFLTSPLQLAVMVSAITNGGKVVVPRIARTRREKASFKGHLRRRLDLRPTAFERVIPGMIGAADYGTAKVIPDEFNVAGKTGSCISGGTWVGLFASVAPANDPQYSVVVITRGSRARGKYSAAIAAKIYEALAPRFGQRTGRTLIAENRGSGKSGADDANIARKPESGSRAQRSSDLSEPSEKGVVKTGSSRPAGTNPAVRRSEAPKGKSVEELFPTIIIVKGKTEIARPRVVNK
jgi:membrane peptidoglycan carboxypeptidase